MSQLNIINKDKSFNYVYRITYPNNMEYIGVRSCDVLPEEDTYMGSGVDLPLTGGSKEILSNYPTRDLADTYESILLTPEYVTSENTYNRAYGQSLKKLKSKGLYSKWKDYSEGKYPQLIEELENRIRSKEIVNSYDGLRTALYNNKARGEVRKILKSNKHYRDSKSFFKLRHKFEKFFSGMNPDTEEEKAAYERGLFFPYDKNRTQYYGIYTIEPYYEYLQPFKGFLSRFSDSEDLLDMLISFDKEVMSREG